MEKNFVALLRACTKTRDLHRGNALHDDILRSGLQAKCSNALVTMYAKCGELAKAKELLDMYKSRDVYTWTAVIAGYAQEGQAHDAFNCFEELLQEGLSPDAVTYSCILKACGTARAGARGADIHEEIAKQGLLEKNDVLSTALVDMYAKCGALAKARLVLEELPSRSVIAWNALIAGYSEHSEGERAFDCYEQMQSEGLIPDSVTFLCILKACGSLGEVERGGKVHNQMAKVGILGSNLVLSTALVDMYAKCGALDKAQKVLEELPIRDVISWNALISGFAEHGKGGQVLQFLEKMQGEGLFPNQVTFVFSLKACGSIRAREKGEKIHGELAKLGLLGNNAVLNTALVDMYAKCGALTKARYMLEELSVRDVVSWNALIAGYADYEEGAQALISLEKMQREGFSPDSVTFLAMLKVCGSMGATDEGERLIDEITKQGLLNSNFVLGTALVAMYAKCGALGRAEQVLEELPVQNIISWNALIAGYVMECNGAQALRCLDGMHLKGLSPNAATFSCVLSACSRLGLVEDARMFFSKMSTEFDVGPESEHYTCMVDLFGRAGYLKRAVGVIERMPSPTSAVWSALLASCQTWGDVEVGRWAFEHAVQEDKSDGGVYVLMANIYTAFGMHKDAESIETMRKENVAWTQRLRSWQAVT